MKNKLYEARKLLLTWFSNRGKVNFAQIKDTCNYLNIRYHLNLETPLYSLWQPLFKSGVIDYCGTNNYALTPSLLIYKSNVSLSINFQPNGYNETGTNGIYRKFAHDNAANVFKGENILSSFPNLEFIIRSYSSTFLDDEQLIKCNGLIKKMTCHYIIIEENSLIKKVPSVLDNPDSYNIAFWYDKIIKGYTLCTYNEKKKTLKILRWGVPLLLYRVLLLETLFSGNEVDMYNRYLIFSGINLRIAKEVDRIILKTMKYE